MRGTKWSFSGTTALHFLKWGVMSFSGTGVYLRRWNLRTSRDAQRAETNTQRRSALTDICKAHAFDSAATLQGLYPAFAADWHNRPHDLA